MEERMKEPWEMTKEELLNFQPPSPLGDSSLSVKALLSKEQLPRLSEYTDDLSIKEWLGYGTRFYTPEAYVKVKLGKPIKVYRAANRENYIFPGAYVTQSKKYAEEHGETALRGKYKILETEAYPHELIPVNPNEFYYAPDPIKWHKLIIERALKEGKPVPPEVLKDYPDLAEKYGKAVGEIEDGKKEAKPKEEAVVEKLAELIEEKERLERELAGETVEGKTPPERTTPISEEERVRERIEEELAKAEKNPDELIFPPPDIPLTFEQVAGLKGIPVFMREDSCFWVPRYVHTSESLLEQVRSEELFKDKFEVVKREIDLLICPKEGVKYGKDYVYHSLVVVYPPTIPQKPVGALFLFKVPRRRFAEILRFRKHVLERFIKGKKKERSREELDFAARVAEEILRRIRIREEISRRIGRV